MKAVADKLEADEDKKAAAETSPHLFASPATVQATEDKADAVSPKAVATPQDPQVPFKSTVVPDILPTFD